MVCYIGPGTSYDLLNHPRIKVMDAKCSLRDMLDGFRHNPPVSLFREVDGSILEMLKKRGILVAANETAKFEPVKGDWVFIVSFKPGEERDGRLVPSSISFTSYLVTEVLNGKK